MTRDELLRWLERGFFAVGIGLAAWCAAVLVEARFHSQLPIPRASTKLKVTQTVILPGDKGGPAPAPAPSAGTLIGRLEWFLWASALGTYAYADAPPSGRITIDLVTVNGSGCPKGTAVESSADNTSIIVSYSDYLAQAGVGANPTDFRKNCQLNVLVHVPQGFSFAIAQATYSGFASLASGASALQRANYYFAGQTPTTVVSHALTGPFEDDWMNTDSADVATLVWSPCGVYVSGPRPPYSGAAPREPEQNRRERNPRMPPANPDCG